MGKWEITSGGSPSSGPDEGGTAEAAIERRVVAVVVVIFLILLGCFLALRTLVISTSAAVAVLERSCILDMTRVFVYFKFGVKSPKPWRQVMN